MKKRYACNMNCPHYYSQFNNCVFYLDLATEMCDTASYNHNINKFCPYAKENTINGEYRVDDDHPTEKEFDEFLQDVGDTPRTPKERGEDK